ncbi:FMN-linked oxidoreductase [Leucosporidium creatinivorum]|uniref:FMN-linked oxidoreductase n=1 Tax=Leucosporidium creatinivorum TaxID=106004 RepID=A0A1Y2DYT5_9BASI|nr:FMN-linked oxidoreductase [Leucosporidium creatinivorum]
MSPALFTPLRVGNMELQHRVAMAPLTRFRANKEHVPSNLATEYYEQRASTPGTLIISEATFIASQAGGYAHVPGIWSPSQVTAWKKIVDAVHAKGSFIYLQLWALGRAAQGKVLKNEPGGPYDVVSASDIPLHDSGDGRTRSTDAPRSLTEPEIQQYIEWYAQAAHNFVHLAGGDGVELHSANGYLPNQFLDTNSNKRTDKWGGSVENRTRFSREIVQAIASKIGAEKTGIRLSPHSTFQGMKMPGQDLEETFSFLVGALKTDHPNLAYIHLTQPRVAGGFDQSEESGENLDFLLDVWAPKPVILAGAYTAATGLAEAEKHRNAIIAYGRHFISNPDLPLRIKNQVPFTPYNRKTFYTPEAAEGELGAAQSSFSFAELPRFTGYTTYEAAAEAAPKL